MKQNDWGIANLIIRPKAVRLRKKSGLIDKLDPYLVISSSATDEKIKTEVAAADKGTFNWDSAYSMRVYPTTQVLDLNCYDYDTVTKDDFLGSGMLYIQKAMELRHIEKTITICKNSIETGEVDLELEYYADEDNDECSIDDSESESMVSHRRVNQSSDIIMDDQSSVIRSTKFGVQEPKMHMPSVLDYRMNNSRKPAVHFDVANIGSLSVTQEMASKDRGSYFPVAKQFISAKQLEVKNMSWDDGSQSHNSGIGLKNQANPLAFNLKERMSQDSGQNMLGSAHKQGNDSLIAQPIDQNLDRLHNSTQYANPLQFNLKNELPSRKRTNSEVFINMLAQKKESLSSQEQLLSMLRNKERRNALNRPSDMM